MQNKQRLELADYEAENLARLQKTFARKWEFVFMQAEAQAKLVSSLCYYLCQVNGVNGGDTVFVRCVSVCVCVSVRSGPVNNSSKTVKATNFKFNMRVSRYS